MVLNHVIGCGLIQRAGKDQGRQWATLRGRTNFGAHQPLIRRDLVSIHKVGCPRRSGSHDRGLVTELVLLLP